MRLRLASSAVSLAIGVTAVVATASAVAAYLYSAHHFDSLIETTRTAGMAQGELIRAALEHQMMENDRSLIGRMIADFGRQPRVRNVLLLDRLGTVRFTSSNLPPAQDLHITSPTCQACHSLPPEQRSTIRAIDTGGGSVLRTMVPFRNREACHRCHEASQKVNGILVFDLDVSDVRASMARDTLWMVTGSGVMTFLLVGAIAVLVRVIVVRRLRRIESSARQIASGDLGRRVPDEGSDTISWLAQEFNTMADSVTGLLGQVRSQRERLETIINSIDDGIAVLDPQRRVIAANDAFLRRVRRSRSQVLGCCCTDLGPGMCTMEDCPTMSCLRSGQPQIRICELRDPNGRESWEEVHASPILDESGRLVQVVEVWRDISERRAAEARLSESHRLASLGLLASGFSHELNTPLGTVLMCVEGILRETQAGRCDEQGWGRMGRSAAIAREQLLRCRNITQHFLRMSRGQASPGGMVELDEAVSAVASLIEPTARAHSVRVDVVTESSGIRVRADESELQHTLVNLALNAIQACQPGGTVALTTNVDHSAHIRVRDNGCGILPEHRRRIFEPFFSLRTGGTGLGLFLSLNFVRQWGGDIVVESEPGVGSTFDVVLPVMSGAPIEPGASSIATGRDPS